MIQGFRDCLVFNISSYLVCAIVQAAEKNQQIGLGEKVPASPLPRPVYQSAHVLFETESGRVRATGLSDWQWDLKPSKPTNHCAGLYRSQVISSLVEWAVRSKPSGSHWPGGCPFFLSGVQLSVQVSSTAASSSRAVFFLWKLRPGASEETANCASHSTNSEGQNTSQHTYRNPCYMGSGKFMGHILQVFYSKYYFFFNINLLKKKLWESQVD